MITCLSMLSKTNLFLRQRYKRSFFQFVQDSSFFLAKNIDMETCRPNLYAVIEDNGNFSTIIL